MTENLNLTKTRYCELWQCPKRAWLKKYRPEREEVSDAALARMKAGLEVGEIAKCLFGEYIDVTVIRDGHLDLRAMEETTRREIDKNAPVICEASFNCNGLYCAVDMLRRESDGWAIYEVKSSTKAKKPVYYADVAYQRYVLEKCGVKVTGVYIVCLNRNYVFEGTLDIGSLFIVSNVIKESEKELARVPRLLEVATETLLSEQEPNIAVSVQCQNPYPCPFYGYCAEGLVEDMSIYDDDYESPREIRAFLDQLWYPLFFLDFETIEPVIPKYIGTRPYDQIPTQFSLHYIEHEGGELKHKEFLAEPGSDPRRAIAERLCADIPVDACVTAYYKLFECSRIKELAESFPDLSDHLLSIRNHVIDLIVPFRGRMLYRKAMRNSFSIKSVLPALFPDDPELDYHNLEGVHNGSEAMTAFAAMENMTPEEQEKTRQNLLEYCELDTLAMVKIWEKLREVAEKV